MSAAERGDFEVSILARFLGKDEEDLPVEVARYLLDLGFSRRDRERMHDLALRNQDGALSAKEREELFAYARTGSVLSILKSRARRMLKPRPNKRTA
jgi:hypothetical protein